MSRDHPDLYIASESQAPAQDIPRLLSPQPRESGWRAFLSWLAKRFR